VLIFDLTLFIHGGTNIFKFGSVFFSGAIVFLHDENDCFRDNNKERIIFQKNNSEKDLVQKNHVCHTKEADK